MAMAMIGNVTRNASSPRKPRTELTSRSSMLLDAMFHHDLFDGIGDAVDARFIHPGVERERDHRLERRVRVWEVARRPAERLAIIRVMMDRNKVHGRADVAAAHLIDEVAAVDL